MTSGSRQRPALTKKAGPRRPQTPGSKKKMGITRDAPGNRVQFLREDEAVYRSRIEHSLPGKRKPYRLIDLFCGAGGMSLGFTEACGHHFKPVWANDYNQFCVDTYNANFGDRVLLEPPSDVATAEERLAHAEQQGYECLDWWFCLEDLD